MERALAACEAAAHQLPSLQTSLAYLQAGINSLGDQQSRLISAVREHKAAAAAAATVAAGALAFALLLRHHRRQQQRTLEADKEEDDEETSAITTLAELRQYRAPLFGAAPITAVCVTRQGVQLSAVPCVVWALRGLQELDLRGNAITAVPAALGNLTALTR